MVTAVATSGQNFQAGYVAVPMGVPQGILRQASLGNNDGTVRGNPRNKGADLAQPPINGQLDAQLDAFRHQLREAQNEVNRVSQRYQAELGNMMTEKEMLGRELQVAKDQLHHAREDVTRLGEENRQLVEANRKLADTFSSVSLQRDSLIRERDSLKGDLDSSAKELQSAKKDLEAAMQERAGLRTELESVKLKAARDTGESKGEAKRLTTELAELKRTMKAKDEAIAKHEREKRKERRSLTKPEVPLVDEDVVTFQERIDQLEAEVASLRKQNQALKAGKAGKKGQNKLDDKGGKGKATGTGSVEAAGQGTFPRS
jgi:uncharacterized protein (DUF3084 family)